MKKLYITDLDGTLLQNDCTLSERTVKIINKFIADGGYSSFSTARSPASISEFLKYINPRIPLILMNGAMIYDVEKMKCIKIEFMEKNHINAVIDIALENHCNFSIFALENEEIMVYNNEKDKDEYYDFPNGKSFIKRYRKAEDINLLRDKNIFYFAFYDKKAILDPINRALKEKEDIEYVYYNDTYEDDFFFLEIFSKNANKGNGLLFLKDYVGADFVTAFGDNSNDIIMLKSADKGIAVSNAVDVLKENADEIIGYNFDDAVSEYIEKDFYK